MSIYDKPIPLTFFPRPKSPSSNNTIHISRTNSVNSSHSIDDHDHVSSSNARIAGKAIILYSIQYSTSLDLNQIPWVSLLGSMYEWYDLASFVSLAPELGQAFFPLLNSNTQLLRVMTIFAAGLCLHPVGALIFGEIGDNGYLSSHTPQSTLTKRERALDRKLNRTRALFLSFVTALVPTIMICFIPKYATAGKASQGEGVLPISKAAA